MLTVERLGAALLTAILQVWILLVEMTGKIALVQTTFEGNVAGSTTGDTFRQMTAHIGPHFGSTGTRRVD
jgi:hypothetical protein